jgi:hypothetical protein
MRWGMRSLGTACVVLVGVHAACESASGPDEWWPEVAELEIVPAASLLLLEGDTLQLSAIARDSAGNTIADPAVVWMSEDTVVATVSPTGLVIGRGAGRARVVAAVGGLVATAVVEGRVYLRDFAGSGFAGCGLSAGGNLYCWLLSPLIARSLPPEPLASLSSPWCGISAAHEGYCWYVERRGETEAGTVARAHAFAPIPGGLAVRALMQPTTHRCLLDLDGAAHCWGNSPYSNQYGQLGIGQVDSVAHPLPEPVAGGLTFSSIVAGSRFTCALTDDGRAYCWGLGSRIFDVGTPEGAEVYPEPVRVAPEWRFSELAAASDHSCGLTGAGEVVCWGWRFPGPTPVAGFTFREITADAGHPTCGLTIDGIRACWGWDAVPTVPPNTSHVRFVELGSGCGRVESGDVVCWQTEASLPEQLLFQEP